MNHAAQGGATFNWEDFCSLAEQWHEAQSAAPDCAEARLRCVISRAYYGVWNLCRQHAESSAHVRPVPESGNTHDNIIQWFYGGETPTHKEIASNLDRLKKSRVTADYKTSWGKTTPQNAAADALFYANRVQNSLAALNDATP